MAQTLSIPDALHARLQEIADQRGLNSIQELLELWQAQESDLEQRRETVRQIDALRERLYATYGEMPDSADLIRKDRER